MIDDSIFLAEMAIFEDARDLRPAITPTFLFDVLHFQRSYSAIP